MTNCVKISQKFRINVWCATEFYKKTKVAFKISVYSWKRTVTEEQGMTQV